MKRAYSVSDWQKDFAKAFAAAVPLEAMATDARGLLQLAQNDEDDLRRGVSTHPVIQAGEADARAILRMQEMREKLNEEYATGLDRVGGEWEGDEE